MSRPGFGRPTALYWKHAYAANGKLDVWISFYLHKKKPIRFGQIRVMISEDTPGAPQILHGTRRSPPK
jgi:hypothetical protein